MDVTLLRITVFLQPAISVFVDASYKGGYNKKTDRYYAEKKVNKLTSTLTVKNNGSSTWRNSNSNKRDLAYNTNTNRNNGSCHFGGHR